MIRVLRIDPYQGSADLSVIAGCLTCGKDVAVRATMTASWAHCRTCRRVAPARVRMVGDDIQVLEAVATA